MTRLKILVQEPCLRVLNPTMVRSIFTISTEQIILILIEHTFFILCGSELGLAVVNLTKPVKALVYEGQKY